jgi:PAS domain S-box-containing protein
MVVSGAKMLWEQQNQLSAFFDSTPEAMILAEPEGAIQDVNPAFSRTFGYRRTEGQSLSLRQLFADVKEFTRALDLLAALEKDDAGIVTFARMLRKDGTIFAGRLTLSQLWSTSPHPQGLAATIHDLSEGDHPEPDAAATIDYLSAQRAFMEVLYFKTPAIMHSIDPRGELRHVSEAWLRRFGYSAEEVIGKKSTDFMTEPSRIYAKDVIEALWRDGSCNRVPYTFVTKTGEHVEIELSATLDLSSGETRTLAILEDVTDRNRALRGMEERNQQLKEFAHAAAHDLQAPLRHISIFSKMIEDDLSEGDISEAKENSRRVQTSVKRLSGMVSGLLEFSLTNEIRLELAKTDLTEIAKTAAGKLQAEVEATSANVVIDALPTLTVDAKLIERVFSGLLENALKFVPEGQPPVIRVSADLILGESVISVADNGIGVPREFRERVFQPLKRLHGPESRFPGYGIGLALCRQIIDAHHGRMWIDDPESGTGSVFKFSLPPRE